MTYHGHDREFERPMSRIIFLIANAFGNMRSNSTKMFVERRSNTIAVDGIRVRSVRLAKNAVREFVRFVNLGFVAFAFVRFV